MDTGLEPIRLADMACSKWGFLLFLSILSFHSIAQDRCGTVRYELQRDQKHPKRETSEQFERWMNAQLAKSKLRAASDRTESSTYTIPVVVHVIHNGEPVGTGTNIPDNQIFSQIDVLNKDYNRLNADAVNTPDEFKPVAGSIDIEFVLAKQDPEGLATTGIVRTLGTESGWTLSDNATFKALSYWPAENYLNLWVVRFVDPTGIIGYAQLPVSTLLAGLEEASKDRLTDGVAIDYRAFGTADAGSFPNLYPQFNKGRTATHEIGHMLGLRHIWGDTGGCSSTDYCSDTPVQDTSTSGCPAQPSQSCGHDKMFQNYMDYTDDPCMNLFTKNQIDRMVVVLGNSPRRTSLLNSPGANDPVTVANDMGIRNVISPRATACPGSLVPSVEIRNYGSNTATSVRIQLSIDGAVTETKDFSFNLAHLDTDIITFSTINLLPATTKVLDFKILLTNGVTDGKASNDTLSQTVVVAAKAAIPLFEPFDSIPSGWTIVNPDSLITWQLTTAPNANPSNTSMFMNFYNYETVDQMDQLNMPVFDLSSDTAAVLKFDRAYATLSSGYADQLRVLVSSSCDLANAVEVFNKQGTALATASSTSNSYVPKSQSDWVTETISLHAFLGQPNVQVFFVSTNDYGNNLYLDNVKIVTGDYTDIKVTEVKDPSPVTCVSHPAPVVTVRNDGSNVVTSINFSVIVNGGSPVTQTFTGLDLNTGQQQDFTLSAWALNAGQNVISVSIDDPLSPGDVNPADNVISVNTVLSTTKISIPLRQTFEGSYPEWTSVSAGTKMKWVPTPTGNNVAMTYLAFNNNAIGDQAWLASPVLDFSNVQMASLFFDVSYAKATTGSDRLQVVASTDCGETFTQIVFDQAGEQLAQDIPTNAPGSVNRSDKSWQPLTNFDWRRQYVNLDNLVGNADVRLAFLATNDHGNNIYVDNIEIFIDDNPNPVAITSPYAVYDNLQTTFKVTFNLPESELVRMQVYTILGQVVIDNEFPQTLNQTYSVDMTGQQAGMYIVKLQMGNQSGTAKVVVPQ